MPTSCLPTTRFLLLTFGYPVTQVLSLSLLDG